MTSYFLIVNRAVETNEESVHDIEDPNQVTQIACGNCGSTDIWERETGVALRRMSVTEDGDIYIDEDDEPMWDSDGFVCLACDTNLSLREEDKDVYDLLTYL